MPVAWKVTERCPRCGNNSNVWVFEKQEGAGIKECYACDSCSYEWSEMIPHTELNS